MAIAQIRWHRTASQTTSSPGPGHLIHTYACYVRFVRFSFLILIGRFVTLEGMKIKSVTPTHHLTIVVSTASRRWRRGGRRLYRSGCSSAKIGENDPGRSQSPRAIGPALHRGRARLCGGLAGAVKDAGGGADVHVECDPVVGVTGHAGDVGDVELPGEQGGGAEDVPQAVPGPVAVAIGVAPADLQVGVFEDVAVEVRGPPVLPLRGREDQPQRVAAGILLRADLLDAGGEPLGQRVAGRGAARIDRLVGACGSSAPRRRGARRPRSPCGPR